jgi:hypothetical protein
MNTRKQPGAAALVNQALKKAGLGEYVFRRGAGYYYVSGVAVSSSLYWCWLEVSDYPDALEHVREVLRAEACVSDTAEAKAALLAKVETLK